MKFVLKKAVNGQFFFVIRAAGNNATLATSETYVDRRDVFKAISLITTDAASAQVVDETANPA